MMNTSLRSRSHRAAGIRTLAVGSCAALIVTGVSTFGQPASAQAAPPAVIVTEASTTSTASPGGLAVVDVSIGNEGDAASGSLSMSLTLPSGLAVDSIATSDPASAWACSTAAAITTCELVDVPAGAALGLDDFDYADATITFAVSSTAVIGAGLTVGVAASAESIGGTPPDLSLAATTLTLLPAPARQFVDVEVVNDLPAELVRSRDTTTITTVRNLGPAVLGGAGSRVVIDGALPTGSTAISVSGTGWLCDVARVPARCVWRGATIPVGGTLAPLALSYVAPSQVTPEDALLEWTRTVRVKPAGLRATVQTTAQEISIVEPGQPSVALEASLTSLSSLEAPAAVDVDVNVVGENLFDPDNTVTVVADVPADFSYAAVASVDGWACGTPSGQLQCTRDANFGDSPASEFTLSLDVAADAAIGMAALTFFAVVEGEPDELLGDNAATIEVQVVERPTAATLLQLYSYPDGLAQPTDGSPFELLVGSATSIGIEAVNNGNSPIAAGTAFTLQLVLPAGTTAAASTDVGAPDWACSTLPIGGGSTLQCTLLLENDVDIDDALPRLNAAVTAAPAAAVGPVSLPVTLAAVASGAAQPALSSTTDINAVVVPLDNPAAQQVTATTTIDVTPRVDGRNGRFTIDVVNNTDARTAPLLLGVTFAPGVEAVEPVTGGCVTGSIADLFSVDVICLRAGPAVGASIVPISIDVSATSSATDPSPVAVVVGPFAVKTYVVGADFDMPVLPALDAVASATPSSVVGQPFGLPQQNVLLDGRNSISLGADVVWRQVPQGAEPLVSFDGVDPGVGEVGAPTATFTAPLVTASTTLHFEFEVSDGTTTSVAAVSVDVAPIPVAGPGDNTGWDTEPAGLGPVASFSGTSAAVAQGHLAPGDPGWVWTTDPTVSLNDHDDQLLSPVVGSRVRVSDHGVFEWNGPPTPAPTDVTVNHQFFQCATVDLTGCEPISDFSSTLPDNAIPNQFGVFMALRVTVSGLVNGLPIETVEDFVLGAAVNVFAPPILVLSPSISGTVEVGQELTLDPGEWSLEFGKEYQWLRCTEIATVPTDPTTSCVDIAGATGSTYTIAPIDIGDFLRGRVTAFGIEGEQVSATSASTIEVPDDGLGTPLEVSTDLAGGVASIPNSGQLDVTGIVDGGREPIVVEWTQTGGPSVIGGPIAGTVLSFTAPPTGQGGLEFTFTATDAVAGLATAVVTVTYGTVDVPGVLCELQNAALAAGGAETTVSLGSAIQLTFAGATVSPGQCSSTTTLDMNGATLLMFDWMRVDDLSVDVTVDGIDFTGGTLTFPGDATLSAMNLRVVTDGLSIPFNLTGADLTAAGSVIADSLPFLGLPGGWEAGAMVSLGSDAGVQTIAFDAIAWDTADGAATTSPDALPVPPAGAAQLTLSGSASTDQTFSFALGATGLVQFGDVGIDFTGSVERTLGNDTVITAAASLANPVPLTSGVSLDAAELGWDGERFTGSGALGISTNGGTLAVTASFDFADASDFSASLALETGQGTPTWTPVAGLTITQPAVTGTLTRSGVDTTVSLTVSAAQVDIGPNFALINPQFDLTTTCSPACQPPAFSVSGDVEVDLGGGEQATASFTGALDLADGAFSVSATLSNLTPFAGLTLNTLELAMAGGAGAPLSIVLTADATVLGLNVTVEISLDDNGFFVAVTLGNWVPGDGAPTFQGAAIVYSSYDTDFAVGGESVEIPANTVLVTAQTSAPSWFTDLIGFNIGLLTIVGTIDLANGNFSVEISFDLPPSELFSLGGVSLEIDDVAFIVARNGSSITTGLTSNGSLIVPNSDGGGTSTLDIRFGAAFSSSGTLSGSVTLVGDWEDAFGVPDLIISNLTVQVTISLFGAGGSFGFAATATLPSAWGTEIGIVNGTPIKLIAQIGTADPCFGLEVGNLGSSTTVLDVANAGAITAKYLSIYIAPTGCTVGPEVLPAGVSLFFDGAVMGVDVTVKASVTPFPLAFSAEVEIGSVQISGFKLNGARIAVEYSTVKRAVEFEASATIFGVTADVSGAFSKTITGTRASFAGVVTAPDLGGFALDELTFAFDFEQSGPTRTLTVAGAASVTILKATQSVSFTFKAVNGRIIEATGDAAIDIPLSPLRIIGTGSFRFVAGQFPDIAVAGSATVNGHSLTSVSGTLNAGGLTFEATLGSAAGFSTPPRLSGVVAFASDGQSTITIRDQNGNPQTAAEGDFRFDATNVGLNVSGFGLLIDVTIGYYGGTFWASFDSEITLGDAGGVAVAGSFASNGDFSLSGSAALNLSGFQLPSGSISVVRSGGTFTVSGDISFAVPKLTTVRFEGTFTRNSQGLFYDLEGSGVVRPGGRNFGSGTFHLYRIQNVGAGLFVDLTLSIPGFVAGAGDISVTTSSLSINTSLSMEGEIGAVLGRPTASVRYLNGPERTLVSWTISGSRFTPNYLDLQVNRLSFSVTARNVLRIPGSVAVYGTVSSTNGFDVSITATAGPYSVSKKFGVCKANASASGSFSGRIIGTSNSLSITFSASLSASAKCGSFKAKIKVDADFSYSSPNRITIKIRLILDFGVKTWKPTVFEV